MIEISLWFLYNLLSTHLPNQIPSNKVKLQNHRCMYSAMMIKGTLLEYLFEFDLDAKQMLDTIVKNMVAKEHISEKFKAENQLEWVCLMENIKHSSKKTVLHDIVYSMDIYYEFIEKLYYFNISQNLIH